MKKAKSQKELSDWVLKSIMREKENTNKGKSSPVFSSVADMKKWVEKEANEES